MGSVGRDVCSMDNRIWDTEGEVGDSVQHCTAIACVRGNLTGDGNSTSLGELSIYFQAGAFMDRVLAPFLADQKQDIAFSFWVAGLKGEETEEAEGLSGQVSELLAEQLFVTSFVVEEVLFGLPRVEVQLISKRSDIDLDKLIDQPATLTIHHKYLDTLRHFSGIVMEAEAGSSGHHRTAYRLCLMPPLSRLDYGSDCRIFQNQTVPEIVGTILKEHGIEDIEWLISEEHQPREFLVCYRETHLAFIERILAEEGIFYYLHHGNRGKSQLILTDNSEHLTDCPGQSHLEYHGLGSTVHYGVYCSSLKRARKLRSTSYRQRDYSFKHPAYNQEHVSSCASAKSEVGGGEQGDYELYDYPGRYKQSSVGAPFTQHKLEAMRLESDLVHGQADTPLLTVGHGFRLIEHPDESLNRSWRLLTIRHEGVQPQAWQEDGQGAAISAPALVSPPLKGAGLVGATSWVARSASMGALTPAGLVLAAENSEGACRYACAFTAQDAELPYRPPQVAKPLVDGPQMAHVVGPEGEEIYTDEYGRVKVHFPWDRHKDPKAEDSSCWIRVASNWAGARWGHIAIPRVGQEVIVEFLEGDPDQPIITGRTYHAVNQPPYKLPENKTKMVIRSDTHKHGDGRIGFNELSFEDENGREKIYIHGQRDQEIHIENNRAKRIDNNQSESVGHNKSIEVGNNHHEVIGGNMTLMVGPNKMQKFVMEKFKVFTDKIGNLAAALGISGGQNIGEGNLVIGVGKNKAETIIMSSSEIVGGAKSSMVGGGYQITVGGVKNESVLLGSYEEIGQNKTITVGKKLQLICGQSKIEMSEDGTILLEGINIIQNAQKVKMN